MPTTYTVPDNPVDPEAAALELIVRLPMSISRDLTEAAFVSGLTETLQDYCGVLHAEGAFAGLSWFDAKPIAAAICLDVCNRENAAGFMRMRAGKILDGTDNVSWQDPAGAARGTDHRRDGARDMTDRRFGPRASAAWEQMIDAYVLTLSAAGQPATTTTLRRIQLVRMARDLGGDPVDVTGDQLVEWFGSRPEWKIETRRSYRSGVRGFFRWAYKAGRLPNHLADELPKVCEKRGAPRPAPDRVWREALMAADARTTLMLRLAAEAGLRRGEVACVHTRDLLEGVDGSQLLVHGKGGKQRVVPIGDSLAELIRQGAAGHTPGWGSGGWLFPSIDGEHLSAWWVGRLVTQVLPAEWTMHTLRHRFASRAYRGTRNLRAVQVLLGHESIATTERYTAVNDDELRAAMMAAR